MAKRKKGRSDARMMLARQEAAKKSRQEQATRQERQVRNIKRDAEVMAELKAMMESTIPTENGMQKMKMETVEHLLNVFKDMAAEGDVKALELHNELLGYYRDSLLQKKPEMNVPLDSIVHGLSGITAIDDSIESRERRSREIRDEMLAPDEKFDTEDWRSSSIRNRDNLNFPSGDQWAKPEDPQFHRTPSEFAATEAVTSVEDRKLKPQNADASDPMEDHLIREAADLRDVLYEDFPPEQAEELWENYNAASEDHAALKEVGSRMATVSQFRFLVKDARRRGYNRQVPDEVLNELVPHMTQMVSPFIVHRHIDGKPAADHYRCVVYVATKLALDNNKPETIIADFSKAAVERLDRVKSKEHVPQVWELCAQLQAETLDAVRRFPVEQRWATGRSRDMHRTVTELLEKAYPYFVTREMLDVVAAAEPKLPDDLIVTVTDFVTEAGFAVLESQPFLEVRDVDLGKDRTVPIAAIGWDIQDENTAIVEFYADLTHPDTQQFYRDHLNGYTGKLFPVVGWVFPLDTPCLREERQDHQPWVAMESERFAAAMFLLLQQRVTLISGHKPARSQRRGAERLGLPSTVRVVTLRRAQVRQTPDGDPMHVEWSHRWVVSGHWRRLRDKDGQFSGRVTWVTPYIKGPDDKPLIVKEAIYVASR